MATGPLPRVAALAALAAFAGPSAASAEAAAGAAAASACPNLNGTIWTSALYSAMLHDDGTVPSPIGGLSATLSVTDQRGCSWSGVNEWSNGEIGGSESVAGVVHTAVDGVCSDIVMHELNPSIFDHSTARIDATLCPDANGAKVMEWRYLGHGSSMSAKWVTAFDAVFGADGAPPATAAPECDDMAGKWQSDPYTPLIVQLDGRRVESTGENVTHSMLLNQTGCVLTGDYAEDTEGAPLVRVAGVAFGSRMILEEVRSGDHAEGRIEGNINPDTGVLDFRYVSHSPGWATATIFDVAMAKDYGNVGLEAAPGVPAPDCSDLIGDSDLVGAYEAVAPVDMLVVNATGDSQLYTAPVRELSFNIMHQEGCKFWGLFRMADGTFLGAHAIAGLVHGVDGTATITQASHTMAGQEFSALIEAHVAGGGSSMTWRYVGLGADRSDISVAFDAVFAPRASNDSAVYEPAGGDGSADDEPSNNGGADDEPVGGNRRADDVSAGDDGSADDSNDEDEASESSGAAVLAPKALAVGATAALALALVQRAP